MLRALILAALTLVWLLAYLPVLIVAYFVVTVLAKMVFDSGWDGKLVVAGVLVAFSSGRYILLLAWSSLGYRKRRLAHVTLLYPRVLERALDMEKIQRVLDESTREMQQIFGRPLLRPVVIIASPTLLMHLRCKWAGSALPYTVMIDPVYANVFHHWQELTRHELAHVATYRVSPLKQIPALLSEGLACYFMRTENGFPLDAHALAILSDEVCEPLFTLDDKAFYHRTDAMRNYILAGSFTGFLVNNVGWERYYRFYALTSTRRWMQDIQKAFGRGVAELEWEWRHSLASREDLAPFLPQLRLYWRALRLAHHWHWDEAVDVAREYLQRYGYDHLLADIVGDSYFMLQRWEDCEQWYRKLTSDDSVVHRVSKGLHLLYLGCCCDLQGKRVEALEAYRAVLQELPVPAWNHESTHTVARRHLKSAFNEKHHAHYVRYRMQRVLASVEA